MANFVTKEQIEQARNVPLGDYLRIKGYAFKMHGNEMYIDDLPGLCVNVQTNSWYNHYEGYGGHNSVDCLTKVLKMDFKDAVSELISRISSYSVSYSVYENRQKPKEKAALKMPEANENYKKLYAYLIKSRSIPREIVDELVHARLLYQDIKGNAVFVHKDENGEIVGGELCGTNTSFRFKGLATGTGDSAFIFKIGEPKKAYVFESGIDLLSFYALANKEKLNNSMLVSMGGLKPNPIKDIEAQEIIIVSCVDNDESGKRFNEINGFKNLNDILKFNQVKDWNELLLKTKIKRNISVEHSETKSGNSQILENPRAKENIENSDKSILPQKEPLPYNQKSRRKRG